MYICHWHGLYATPALTMLAGLPPSTAVPNDEQTAFLKRVKLKKEKKKLSLNAWFLFPCECWDFLCFRVWEQLLKWDLCWNTMRVCWSRRENGKKKKRWVTFWDLRWIHKKRNKNKATVRWWTKFPEQIQK